MTNQFPIASILAAVCLAILLGRPTTGLAQVVKPATSFQLYYGNDQKLLDDLKTKIEPRQVVVVDARSLTAFQFGQLRRATKDKDAKLLAYISIGELHSREMGLFEAFAQKRDPSIDLDKLKSKVLISKNITFSSLHVDASDSMWRKFIAHKAKDNLATGVDGLFLDTVDTVDVYANKKDWKLDRRGKSVSAMITLIREIKQLEGSPYVMQNRGLNLIGKEMFIGEATGIMVPGQNLAQHHELNPDAILYEDAFSSSGGWGTKIVSNLDEIQKSGEATVVALGYKESIINQRQFLEKCKLHKFVPSWASNSRNLHLEIAR